MDDSIYRDLYWAQDQMEIWWANIAPVLTSDQASRLYALATALTILGLSIWCARGMMRELKLVETKTFGLRKKGRKPYRPEVVEEWREEIRTFRVKQWRTYFRIAALLVVFGFVIPSAALYLGSIFYGWIDPLGHAFVTTQNHEAVMAPSRMELAIFIFNQMSHGALMDAFEVFQLDYGGITNDPSNYSFSAAVLLYRSLIGSYTLALLFFLWRAIVIAWNLPPVEELVPGRPATAA
jgi:hypothetical protein